MGCLVCFCVEAAAFGQSAPQALSDLMVRRARMFAAIPLAKSSDLELAHRVAVRATELVPTDAEAWRLRMDIARLHEEQEDAERCLRRLVELRPFDERLVLERLDLALTERQTVEARLEGLDVILAEPLSGHLQARLWWRRALLRQGRAMVIGGKMRQEQPLLILHLRPLWRPWSRPLWPKKRPFQQR